MSFSNLRIAATAVVAFSLSTTGCSYASKSRQASMVPYQGNMASSNLARSSVGENQSPNEASVIATTIPRQIAGDPSVDATNGINTVVAPSASSPAAASPSIESRMRLTQSYSSSAGGCNDACCRR